MVSNSSTVSLLVVGAVWVALLWGSSVDALRAANRNLGSNYLARNLKSEKSASVSYEEEEIDESKSSKKKKSCKSSKKYKNYYGYYDHCFEDDEFDMGNSTDYDDEDYEEEEYSYKSYKSKGSKGSKSNKSSKKSSKSKSDKKSCKSGKSGDCEEKDDGFTPSVSWDVTFPDAVDTGFLFYDEVTMLAWYAYTAETTITKEDIVTVENKTVTHVTETEATIGRICPIDVAVGGKIKEDMCIEIMDADATSTEIVAAETCLSTVNDSILKMAVVVEGSEGSSLIVYDIVVAGKTGGDIVDVEVTYDGWKSLYGEPGINGQPSFTPDCKRVFATWLNADEDGLVTSTTVATNVEKASEIWRLGTSSRLVGLTSTKDGKSLISATHVPTGDTHIAGGIVKLDASTGQVEDEFAWPANALRQPHNAFTNVVLDKDGNSYHIDSLLGLVKFEGDDLNNGPVWSAVGGSYREEEFISEEEVKEEVEIEIMEEEGEEISYKTEIEVRRLELESPRTARSKIIIDEDEVAFTAFQPALDESDHATVYGCGMTTRGDESDGVIALAANNGDRVWHAKFDDHYAVNVGSCRGITDDIVYGPSTESSTGYAVYVARHNVIEALDAKNGTSLWSFEKEGDGPTKFVVLSDDAIIAANGETVCGLETMAPPPPGTSPEPTQAPTPNAIPSKMPSRSPLAVPTPSPVGIQTTEPSSASTRGFSYIAAAMAAIPLLFMLR